MELVQIKTLLNDLLTKTGAECGAVDDFSWQDTGTAISALTADAFKTFNEKFALGVVKTYFETRRWSKSLDIMTDAQTYEGIKQYVKAGLLEADDVSIVALVDGRDYTDGVYKELDAKAKIYTKDFGYRMKYSVPNEDLKFMFSSEASVRGYVALIEATVANSMNKLKWNTQLSTLVGLIVRALSATTPKKIPVLTKYNSLFSKSLTKDDCFNDVDFKRWLIETVANMRSYITDINTKYNNEGVESFTPKEDTRVTLLTAVHNSLRNISTFEMIGTDLTLGEYNTVNSWQSTGTGLLPSLDDISEIVDNSDATNPVTYDGVIGVIYDKYSLGMTMKCQKVTSQYIGGGDFTQFYPHVIGQSFINEFNNAIVLTLE